MNYSNILITGGSGFIGTNFIDYITKKYPHSNFYNIDCLNYCSNNICHQISNLKFIELDLSKDIDKIYNIFIENNIDCVIHFAAQTHVDNSYDNTIDFIKDNIISTYNLLECCKKYLKFKDFLKLFIYISTDEVYGDSTLHENPLSTEESRLEPTNPYSATKASAEMLCMSYMHSYNIPLIITRGNNVYGPHQYKEKLIPKFILSLKNNKKCTIHGSGLQLRSFIHVYDLSRAIDIIINKGQIREIYNIGSDEEISVIELTKLLISFICTTHTYEDYIEYVEDRLYNDKRYLISNDKIKKLGFKQEILFNDGIKDLVNFYKNF